MATDEEKVTICAVGDIVPNRKEPESLFILAAPYMKQGDIVFGQLESVITDKYGYMDSSGWGPPPADPKNIKALTEKSFLAIFVSSGEASDKEKYQEAKEKYVQKIITDLGLDLNKVMHEAFGGVFDMSSTSRMGRLDKMFSNMGAKEDENITENEYNDLRDWDQIKSFVNEATTRILQL